MDCGVRGPRFKSWWGWFFQLKIKISFFIDLTQSFVSASSLCRSSQTKRWNKREFYCCQTSVIFLYNWGIFSGYQSLLTLYLSGTPSLRTGTRPPTAYTSSTVYKSPKIVQFIPGISSLVLMVIVLLSLGICQTSSVRVKKIIAFNLVAFNINIRRKTERLKFGKWNSYVGRWCRYPSIGLRLKR